MQETNKPKTHAAINDPVFHNIVKSVLHYYKYESIDICSKIPKLSKSNLFSKGIWHLDLSQEEYMNEQYRRHDVVWLFSALGINYNYLITHEVKTRNEYDIDEIISKYYLGSQSQIWVWGWHTSNLKSPPKTPKGIVLLKRGVVKQLDIEYLLPIIIPKISFIYNRLMEG